MRYNRAAAEALRRMAVQYKLSGAELLEKTALVMQECNGVGADWMPDSMRQLCTKMNSVMEIPAAIHDIRYIVGVDRLSADSEFLSNVLRMVELTYPWWNPLRYIMRHRAMRYYEYLRAFGGRAWLEAKKKQ